MGKTRENSKGRLLAFSEPGWPSRSKGSVMVIRASPRTATHSGVFFRMSFSASGLHRITTIKLLAAWGRALRSRSGRFSPLYFLLI